MSDKFVVEVDYETPGETKSAELQLYMKTGETRMKVILEIIQNGFRIETKERGIFRFIPPGRIYSLKYAE